MLNVDYYFTEQFTVCPILGDMDAADREIEQFKQFCFNSVPVQNRAKVNFDVKNIAFKKKT